MEATLSRVESGGPFVAEFRIWVANSFPSARIETVSAEERTAPREKDYLILKRASASRPSGEWSDDDFDVLCDGAVVGRIMKAAAVPAGMSWMWTLAFGYREDCTPTHGYAETRGAAMAAFGKSWRRE